MTTITMETSLEQVVRDAGVLAASSEDLVRAFGPAFTSARDLVATAATLTVTDATQVSEMKAARQLRLKLKDVRVGAEKLRKDLKADSLARGKAVDNVAKMIAGLCEGEETRLEECEKFAERAEAKRKDELETARRAALSPFVPNVQIYPLREMDEAAWAQLLTGSRVAFESAKEAARKAEDDRLAAIEADRQARAKLEEENKRLAAEKAEADRLAKIERDRAEAELAEERAKAAAEKAAIEAKAKAEREAAEAVARKEREEAQAKLDAERKQREESEAKARREREAADKKAAAERAEADRKLKAAQDDARKAKEAAEAEARRVKEAAEAKAREEAESARKAAAAPDAEKLRAFAAAVRAMNVPDMATPSGRLIAATVREKVAAFAVWIDARAGAL